ncbi:diguanylate cyclase [Alcanivorax sp.]|uniref:sensor domain-containing diguanylate cyclase n=1 Tax=Alcanivorax sp. TaxID=1872427 RepID=UPI0025C257DD|nr:diguanylate cyclase [Alcanivorax sp.]
MEEGADLRLVGLKELHRLSLLDGADSRELYRQYLEVGCRLLGLSVGIISRVQGQDYQVLAVQSDNDTIRAGDHYALGDTYCAEVLAKQGSVALHDVGALESMRSHPAYTGLQLQAYIATPIRVQGDIVGTLNFSDTRPRPEPFSMEEMEFLELMALSLGHGLERSWLETQRVRAVTDMETNVALFEGAFRHAAIGMAIVAPNGRWLRVNEAVSQIVGYSDSELREIDFQTITHPDDLDKDLEQVDSLLRGDATTYRMKKRYTHKEGREVWVLLAVSLVRNSDGTPRYFLSQLEDITAQVNGEIALREQRDELEQLNRELAGLARQDALTGLSNRPVILEQLRQNLKLGLRTREPLSLVLVEVGNLDQLNQQHGHAVGDDALVAVAEALGKLGSGKNCLGRFTGQQFLMLLPEAGLNQAEDVAEDCRQAVLSLADVPLPLTVSLGVATLMPCDAEQVDYGSTDAALQAAETALSAARDAGKNCCRTVTL